MQKETVTFDKLPEAVGYLPEQVIELKKMVAELQPQPSDKHILVEFDDACQIIRKAKPTIYSRPLKSPFLRDIVQVQYLAYFLKHAQKNFHSSFEVICCCREKYVHSIFYHTLIKVATQTIIRL